MHAWTAAPMSKPFQIIAFPFVALLAIPAILLFVWVGMPLLFSMMIVDLRRLRKAVRTCPCVECGQLLGLESLALAAKESPEPDPDSFDRFCCRESERTLDAICPTCGTRYSFVKGRLILESERLHDVHA
jgi:hypothetical protein